VISSVVRGLGRGDSRGFLQRQGGKPPGILHPIPRTLGHQLRIGELSARYVANELDPSWTMPGYGRFLAPAPDLPAIDHLITAHYHVLFETGHCQTGVNR